jgi:hypothetical protein
MYGCMLVQRQEVGRVDGLGEFEQERKAVTGTSSLLVIYGYTKFLIGLCQKFVDVPLNLLSFCTT